MESWEGLSEKVIFKSRHELERVSHGKSRHKRVSQLPKWIACGRTLKQKQTLGVKGTQQRQGWLECHDQGEG